MACRQAPEQYLTASQVRAQRRRQVIGRPQAMQGLLGSEALLPRNDGVGVGMLDGPGVRVTLPEVKRLNAS